MRQSLGQWYDYSAGWPGGMAIKASGAVGILVYIGEGSQKKRITGAQYREAIAAGLQVRFVCELNTHDTERGWAGGVEFAHATLADFAARGIPRRQYVACAADEHLTPAQVQTAVLYARGFESVIGRDLTGCYGFREFIRACIGRVGSWYWLAGSPPPADLDDWVLFWQRNDGKTWVSGIECDINEQLLPLNSPQEIDMQPTDKLRAPFTRPDGSVIEYTASDWWTYGNKYAGDAAADAAACKAMLATLVASQQGDLNDQQVLDHLTGTLTDELTRIRDEHRQQLEQLRAEADAARVADRAATEAAVREVLGENDTAEADAVAERVLARIADKLRPATT